MTIDYLKDLIFDALNEDEALNLQELHWSSDNNSFVMVTEDNEPFLLSVRDLKGKE